MKGRRRAAERAMQRSLRRAWGRRIALLAVVFGYLPLAAVAGAEPGWPSSEVADAAMRGDTDEVRALLQRGADVNVAQGDGMTALHWAAANGDAELAAMLLYAGAHVEAATRLGSFTPLHIASQTPSPAVVRVLLESGADVDARTTAGGAAPLHLAASTGSTETIDALVEHGAAVDLTSLAWEQTPLMFAAAANRVEAVGALLRHGAQVDASTKVVDVVARDEADRAAVRLRNRQRAALRALEEEAEAAESDEEEAAEGEEAEPVEGESEAEGEPEAESQPEGEQAEAEGKKPPTPTAEETAPGQPAGEKAPPAETELPGEKEQPAEGEAPAEEEKLEEDDAPEDEAETPATEEDDDEEEPARPPTYAELVGGHGGLTALLYAAREGHADTVALLLEAGADIDQVSGGDHTSALLIATLNGHFDLAMRLLESGADPDLASDAGTTPLYAALNVRWAPRSAYPQQNAYKQQTTTYTQLMTALLEAGADPNVRLSKHLWYTSFNFDHLLNSTGATPFWRAAYATDVEAMRLLVAHGADPGIPTSKLPRRGRPRPQGEDGKEDEEADPSGLPPVPVGGPAVYPLHAAAGAGYGEGFAGYAHQHVPDGWLPAVRYLVDELGADVNLRDHNAYNLVHHAAARGDTEMIAYLVARGADVTALSRKGQSTVDMANGPVQRIQPFPEAIALLEALGAQNNHNCVSC